MTTQLSEKRQRERLQLATLALDVAQELPSMTTVQLQELAVRCFCERALLICSNRADASDALNTLAEAIKTEMQKRIQGVRK